MTHNSLDPMLIGFRNLGLNERPPLLGANCLGTLSLGSMDLPSLSQPSRGLVQEEPWLGAQ